MNNPSDKPQSADRTEGSCPATCSDWEERWQNSELRFCDVKEEHRGDWLAEQAKWLFTGRRWPITPTESMVKHCIYWWPRIARLMDAHGWWPEFADNKLTGYQVTWRLGESDEYKIIGGSEYAHYAAVTAAIIVRRKARYYGLWNRPNAESSQAASDVRPAKAELRRE